MDTAPYDGLHDRFEAKGWGTPHIGFTVASMCAYEMDKIFFDLLRVRQHGIEKDAIDEGMEEFRSAWYRRIDPLARSKLTDRQYQAWKGLKDWEEKGPQKDLRPGQCHG